VLGLSGREAVPLQWNFRHGRPVCRVGDSTLANNSTALATNVRKPAQLLYDADEEL
jgi:hypothetical protein